MASSTFSEGTVPFAIANAGKDCHTWYKIFGTLSEETIPLITLHGGPGTGHDYLLSLADLASQYQIPVIMYDQIGCGNSTLLPEKCNDAAFWTVDLFAQELDNLLKHLKITQFDLFGHSWGGMLASIYAAKQPAGLRKLILMSAPASIDLLLQGSAELRQQLPPAAQEIIQRCQDNMEFDLQEFQDACLEFYKRFVCRCDPWPPELLTSLHRLEDPTVYGTMFGPSEMICTGNLRGWTAIPVAHRIRIPTLVVNGEYDEVVPAASAPYVEEIPQAKSVVLPRASHTAMWEEREELMRVISDFLGGSHQA